MALSRRSERVTRRASTGEVRPGGEVCNPRRLVTVDPSNRLLVTFPETSAAQAPCPLLHRALLYRNAEQLDRVLREFVATAAADDEPVLVALPSANLDLLRDTLGAAAREVRFEDMTAVSQNPNCLLDLYDGWIRDHAGRGHVIGESIWPGRSYAETVECLRHEALVNHAFQSVSATFLCPFDAERLDADALIGAELTHPGLIDGDGTVRPSESYAEPLEIAQGLRWPQEPPVEPVSEHRFVGDLHALRASVADDPITRTLLAERRADLVFATHEAATNAIKHGDGRCTTRLWRGVHGVVSEVSTASTIPDALAGRRRPARHALSGRGLWLINQVCDLVELRSGGDGTTLRMHVHG